MGCGDFQICIGVPLKAEQDKIVKLQAFDSRDFHGKTHFKDNGQQSYLVFQADYKYFKKTANSVRISAWKSKRLSDKSTKPPAASNNSLSSALNYFKTSRSFLFTIP